MNEVPLYRVSYERGTPVQELRVDDLVGVQRSAVTGGRAAMMHLADMHWHGQVRAAALLNVQGTAQDQFSFKDPWAFSFKDPWA